MEDQLARRICGIAAWAVLGLVVAFVLALGLTFDFSPWQGIAAYMEAFAPVQLLTVIPSILLAFAYVVFVSALHTLTDARHRIWSQLALSFGLLYAGISCANYLIQLVTVIPSVRSGVADGLTMLVSGYPNSIFFALMASYFLMCLSMLCAGLAIQASDKRGRWARGLLIVSGLAIPLFLVGALIGIAPVMMSGALCWMLGGTVGMAFTALSLKGSTIPKKN